MGFRSVAITEHVGVTWPDWLERDRRLIFWRYSGSLWYTDGERKFYDMSAFEAFREALIEVGFFDRSFDFPFRIVLMHEDDTVEQVSIHKNKIERHWMERFGDKPKVAPLASGQAVKHYEVEE